MIDCNLYLLILGVIWILGALYLLIEFQSYECGIIGYLFGVSCVYCVFLEVIQLMILFNVLFVIGCYYILIYIIMVSSQKKDVV
jgi:hypothetical protein